MMGQMLQTLHMRFDGRSTELPLAALDLRFDASDQQIKRTVASHFQLPPHALDEYVVIRSSNAVIVRPEAIYG